MFALDTAHRHSGLVDSIPAPFELAVHDFQLSSSGRHWHYLFLPILRRLAKSIQLARCWRQNTAGIRVHAVHLRGHLGGKLLKYNLT